MPSIEYQVVAEDVGQRADRILAKLYPDISRTKLQKLFDNEEVTVDGEPISKSTVVKADEILQFPHPHTLSRPLKPTKVPFDVLFEDKSLIIINKQPGIAVHPVSADDEQVTIAHGVAHLLKGKAPGPIDRPGIVHRLDKETSGVLIMAKTEKAFEKMKAIFADREIEKEYLAVVRGCPDLLAGSITAPIGRSPRNPMKMVIIDSGRESRTDWERVAVDEKAKIALLKCELHTGRTHQARVHLQHLGHPVLGDTSYGYRGNYKGRILLHAHRVRFAHPTTGKKMEIEAPLPKDMKAFKTLFKA